MTQQSYTVGWFALTPEQLEKVPPWYRSQAQYIRTFGNTESTHYPTPGEAQWLLDQIVRVNSENNLKALTPLGAQGLFIVQREETEPGCRYRYRRSKYTPPNRSHVIPSAPAQAGSPA